MDTDSLVVYFENEQWPNFKFHIELSDEVFGAQLEKVTQTVRPIVLTYVSDDIENREQAILWKDYQYLVVQYLLCDDIEVMPGMTYSYKEFPKEVLSAFSDLIVKHQLNIEIEQDNQVELRNESVILKFSFDRGEFFADLRKSGKDYTFALWQIINYLDLEVWNKEKSKDYPGGLLRLYAKTLDHELSSVFSGNFPWYEGLKAQKQYESSLMRIFWKLDKEHPIRQKFWKGDKTWKEDMEAYVEENEIQLTHPKE